MVWQSAMDAAEGMRVLMDGLPASLRDRLGDPHLAEALVEPAPLELELERRARGSAYELLGERDAALGVWERQLRDLVAARH